MCYQADPRLLIALDIRMGITEREHRPPFWICELHVGHRLRKYKNPESLVVNPARRYLADLRFQKALEVGLGINMTTGDAFARGNGAGAAPPPGARGADASTAAPMEEEEYDDDDDGPPPLEVRGASAGCWRLRKAWC